MCRLSELMGFLAVSSPPSISVMVVISKELWFSHAPMSLLQVLPIAAFFLLLDMVICALHWFSQRGRILEYGYPRVKNKTIKKKLHNDFFLEKIFMVRLCRNAKRGGLYLWICWLMNILNILSALTAIVGAIGAVITHADGWSGCLLLFPPLGCLLGATALLFIPDLICLPSERKRYRWK